jgi:hypothetical protein
MTPLARVPAGGRVSAPASRGMAARGNLIKNRNLRARRGGQVAPAVSAPRG